MSAAPDASLGRRTIGEILLEHGFVTQEQVDEATAVQAETGRPLGQILVEGTPSEISADRRVQEIYLGGGRRG